MSLPTVTQIARERVARQQAAIFYADAPPRAWVAVYLLAVFTLIVYATGPGATLSDALAMGALD